MGFDGAIYSYISNELRYPALKMAGRFAAGLELGDQLASFCLLFIMAGYVWQKPRLVKTFTGALFSLAAGGIAVQIFKYLIGRARPAEGVGDLVFIGPHFSPGGYDAFPSGHTTALFSLLAFVCRFYPGWTIPLYVAGFLLSVLGRVVTGQHFLTDVVGGAVLGSAVGILLARRWRATVEAPVPAPGDAPAAEEPPAAAESRPDGRIAMLAEVLLVGVFSFATLFMGAGSEFSPQFHSALMGLLTALAAYFLARRLCGADTALYAALILSGSFLFVNLCRLLPGDTAWLFFTTLAFTYYVYSTAGVRRSNLLLALAYAAIGLALLARGLPALYAVAVFLLYEYLSEKPSLRAFLLGSARRHLLFLGATLLAAAPWIGRGLFSYAPEGDFFFDEIVARAGLTRHAGRVVYYLPVLLGALFPWTFFGLAYFVQAGRRWRRSLDGGSLLLFLWALLALALFPLVAAKSPHLMVIALPPLALLLGRFVRREIGRAALNFSLLATLFTALSAVVAAVVLFRVRPEYASLKFAAPFAVLSCFLAAAWLLRNRPAFFAVLCMGTLGFYASAILIALGP